VIEYVESASQISWPTNRTCIRRLEVPLDGVSATRMWNILNIVCFLTIYINGKAAVGQHYKRLKSREGRVNDCPPRLAESVFKHYCTEFTLCENDKACEKQEICVCNKHCGKVCIDPSKSKYPVLHPVRINSVV